MFMQLQSVTDTGAMARRGDIALRSLVADDSNARVLVLGILVLIALRGVGLTP